MGNGRRDLGRRRGGRVWWCVGDVEPEAGLTYQCRGLVVCVSVRYRIVRLFAFGESPTRLRRVSDKQPDRTRRSHEKITHYHQHHDRKRRILESKIRLTNKTVATVGREWRQSSRQKRDFLRYYRTRHTSGCQAESPDSTTNSTAESPDRTAN